MGKTLKKVWNILSTLLVAAVVLLALLLAGARVVGLKVYTVLSGSMEPEYPVGSVIYVKAADYKALQPGDVITFMLNEDTVATHRITEVLIDENDPDTYRFFTKGDANSAPDGGSVHYKNIIGTPVFTVPYLGYIADFIRHPPGMYYAIAIGAVLLLLVFLPDMAEDKEKSKKKKSPPAAAVPADMEEEPMDIDTLLETGAGE